MSEELGGSELSISGSNSLFKVIVFIPVCDFFLLLFLCHPGPFLEPDCVGSCGLLDVRGSVIYSFVSFWELGPRDLESCHPNPFLSECDISLFIPIIVHCVLRGVVCACSRLPHHVVLYFSVER